MFWLEVHRVLFDLFLRFSCFFFLVFVVYFVCSLGFLFLLIILFGVWPFLRFQVPGLFVVFPGFVSGVIFFEINGLS